MLRKPIAIGLGLLFAALLPQCGEADHSNFANLRVVVGAASAEFDQFFQPGETIDIQVDGTIDAVGTATYTINVYQSGQPTPVATATLTDQAPAGATTSDAGYGAVTGYVMVAGGNVVNVTVTWQQALQPANLDVTVTNVLAPVVVNQTVDPAAGQEKAGQPVNIQVTAQNRSAPGAPNDVLTVKSDLTGTAGTYTAVLTYDSARNLFFGSLTPTAPGLDYELTTTVTDDRNVSASISKPYPVN